MADLDSQSLRGFLARLERELPEEFLRIKEPVRTKLDITSLVFELESLGQEPGRRVRERRRPHDAGRDQRRRKSPGARARLGRRRRPSCRRRSANAAPATSRSSGSTGPNGTTSPSRGRRRPHQVADYRCISRSTPPPTSPPARSRRAIPRPESTPPAFIGSCSRTATGSASRCIRGGACGSFTAARPRKGRILPAAITLGVHPLHYMGSMTYAYPPERAEIRDHRGPVQRAVPAWRDAAPRISRFRPARRS